jgi:hypothetical protein
VTRTWHGLTGSLSRSEHGSGSAVRRCAGGWVREQAGPARRPVRARNSLRAGARRPGLLGRQAASARLAGGAPSLRVGRRGLAAASEALSRTATSFKLATLAHRRAEDSPRVTCVGRRRARVRRRFRRKLPIVTRFQVSQPGPVVSGPGPGLQVAACPPAEWPGPGGSGVSGPLLQGLTDSSDTCRRRTGKPELHSESGWHR